MPWPHDWVHCPHAVQSDCTQSTAHGSMLQAVVSSSAGQTLPPFFGCTVTLRTRRCVPPPQVCVHVPNLLSLDVSCRRRPWPHSPTTQFSGQFDVPQDCSSYCEVQATPPYEGATVISRVRLCMPPPQVTEQTLKEVHGASWQSTGHGLSPHVCSSVRFGQELPPCAGMMLTERERLCEPLPHVLVHADQVENADVWQWIGHGPSLHDPDSLKAPQTTPPWAAGFTTERVRVRVPSPHVLEHALHNEKAEVMQFTGQELSLHDCSSDKLGQIAPLCKGWFVTDRVRVCSPPPHDIVQVLHCEKALTSQSTGHGPRLHIVVSARCGHS